MVLDMEDFPIMNKFLTKIWNAFRFSEMHLKEGRPPLERIQNENSGLALIDRYTLIKLNETIAMATTHFEAYDFRKARMAIDRFFRTHFCDDYIEICKDRLYNPNNYPEHEILSAKYTLYEIALALLKLYAPFIPHITEELFQHIFCTSSEMGVDNAAIKKEGWCSIHLAEWPSSTYSLCQFLLNEVTTHLWSHQHFH